MATPGSMTERWSQISCDEDDEGLVMVGRIHGLRARADLNGKLARAVRFIQSKGRWALIVDGGEKVLVKDENIEFSAIDSGEENQSTQQTPSQQPVKKIADVKEESSSPLPVAVPVASLVAAPQPLPPFLQCLCVPFTGGSRQQIEDTQPAEVAVVEPLTSR